MEVGFIRSELNNLKQAIMRRGNAGEPVSREEVLKLMEIIDLVVSGAEDLKDQINRVDPPKGSMGLGGS